MEVLCATSGKSPYREEGTPFLYPFYHPATWNIDVMTGMSAATLNLEDGPYPRDDGTLQ